MKENMAPYAVLFPFLDSALWHKCKVTFFVHTSIFMNVSYAFPIPFDRFLLKKLGNFRLSRATRTKTNTPRRFFL